MESNRNAPLHLNPQYLHGQLLALRAVVVSLARVTADPASFREASLQRLELLRTALLGEPVSDAQLAGVDEFELWLKAQLEPT